MEFNPTLLFQFLGFAALIATLVPVIRFVVRVERESWEVLNGRKPRKMSENDSGRNDSLDPWH